MLSQFHPHNAHVSACTLCLVGDLKSLLCGFRRERLNLHSTNFRASHYTTIINSGVYCFKHHTVQGFVHAAFDMDTQMCEIFVEARLGI